MASSQKNLIWWILLLAAVLRLWGLSAGDAMGDEVLLAFRAIGMLDFDYAEFQPTPLEWWDPEIPEWTKLSFHDHPPLVFLIQHIFMSFLGETPLVFRLPSAILGVASVYLIYLIAKLIFSPVAGLISAGLLAVTVNHVDITRTGLQEPYVIFFILLAMYLFLKSLKDDRYFLWAGVAVGLGGLAKYTSLIVVPIFLTYILIYQRRIFYNKKFWSGVVLAVLIFSPVIIYNLQLYRAVGHFDFQFSYIFGQNPEVWQVAPGKEMGTLSDRLADFLPRIIGGNSWLFLIVVAASFLFLRQPLIIISFIYLFVAILLTGPAFRFLTMLTPFFVLSAANALQRLRGTAVLAILAPLFIWEVFYSINSQLPNLSLGADLWTYSKTRYENNTWGYNELDKFLISELRGKMPAITFNLSYQFLVKEQERGLTAAKRQNKTPYPALIVYDRNFFYTPQIWILGRRQIYDGWPTLSIEDYLSLPDKDVFLIKYFIIPTDKVPLKNKEQLTDTGIRFESALIKAGILPVVIKNRGDEEVFRIYKLYTAN